MNTLKPLSPSNSGKAATPKARYASFLEALSEQSKAATVGIGRSALDQLAGQRPVAPENKPPVFNFEEYLQLREQQVRYQERTLIERQRGAEVLVYHRKEELCKREIEFIKQEIKTLVIQTGKLSSELVEAERTVAGRTPDIKSGAYYFSFFERIRRLIRLAKKRITESRTWMQEFTGRCQAKSFYWSQSKSSGTRFTLSQERYMATQAG